MTDRILTWLFDLETIRLGADSPLRVEWSTHLPAWVLAALSLAALSTVFLVYRREQASGPRRIILGAIRCALIALAITLLCGPTLVLQRNQVEPAFVSIAVDNSLSMSASDVYQPAAYADAIRSGSDIQDSERLRSTSRLDLVKEAFHRDDAKAFHSLIERNSIHLARFSHDVETLGIAPTRQSVEDLVEAIAIVSPKGTTTDLAGAIAGLVNNAQGRRLAALLLATDGQSTQSTSLREAVDLARGRQIPIYPLKIGSPEKPIDVEVGPLRAEDRLFVKDRLAIEARVRTRGLTAPTPVKLSLYDEQDNRLVDTRIIEASPTQSALAVELHAVPKEVGPVKYRVEAEALPDEYSTANNSDSIALNIANDRLRVLYVEGYPRYEYRYLKNALLRESTIEVSVLLIEADEEFVQDGTLPIRRFPQTPEELNRYDLVLFGDVDPRSGWLTLAQMRMLLDFVGNEGGGFGTIAGERWAPARFFGTPLERLLPIHIDPEFAKKPNAPISEGFRPGLTKEGERNRIFRLGGATRANRDAPEATTHMEPSAAPELFWIARTLGPKPGASVLLEHPDLLVPGEQRAGRQQMPVVVVGRYGAGKIFFQGSDDTWRWRRHTGEFLHDTYWVQVSREIMRVQGSPNDNRLEIVTDQKTYEYGEPVRIDVRVADSQILADHPEALGLTLTLDGSGSPNEATEVLAYRLGQQSSRYEARMVPPSHGKWTVRVEGVGFAMNSQSSSTSFRVNRPDLEFRRPEANHDALQMIADATGGSVVELDQLAAICASIPDRSVRIPDDVTEPLWDSKIAMALFIILVSSEWILRKASGLQ